MPIPLAVATGIGGAAGALSGWIGGNAEEKRRNRLMNQLLQLYSPENLAGEASKLFNLLRSSPAYGAARYNAMRGAASLANNLQTSFAQRGLTRSGLAGMAMPIAQQSFIPAFMNIDTRLFEAALSQIKELLDKRAGIMTAGSGPSAWDKAFSGLFEGLSPGVLKLLQGAK